MYWYFKVGKPGEGMVMFGLKVSTYTSLLKMHISYALALLKISYLGFGVLLCFVLSRGLISWFGVFRQSLTV